MPLLIGDRRIEVEGVTEFVPVPPEEHGPGWPALAAALAGVAAVALLRRRLGRRPSPSGGTPPARSWKP